MQLEGSGGEVVADQVHALVAFNAAQGGFLCRPPLDGATHSLDGGQLGLGSDEDDAVDAAQQIGIDGLGELPLEAAPDALDARTGGGIERAAGSRSGRMDLDCVPAGLAQNPGELLFK